LEALSAPFYDIFKCRILKCGGLVYGPKEIQINQPYEMCGEMWGDMAHPRQGQRVELKHRT